MFLSRLFLLLIGSYLLLPISPVFAATANITGSNSGNINQTLRYQVNVSGSNLSWASFYSANVNSDLGQASSWTILASNNNCSGNSCSLTGNFTPQNSGEYWLVVNVGDRNQGICSGNPVVNRFPGLTDCGQNSRLKVTVSSPSRTPIPTSTPTLSTTSRPTSTPTPYLSLASTNLSSKFQETQILNLTSASQLYGYFTADYKNVTTGQSLPSTITLSSGAVTFQQKGGIFIINPLKNEPFYKIEVTLLDNNQQNLTAFLTPIDTLWANGVSTNGLSIGIDTTKSGNTYWYWHTELKQKGQIPDAQYNWSMAAHSKFIRRQAKPVKLEIYVTPNGTYSVVDGANFGSFPNTYLGSYTYRGNQPLNYIVLGKWDNSSEPVTFQNLKVVKLDSAINSVDEVNAYFIKRTVESNTFQETIALTAGSNGQSGYANALWAAFLYRAYDHYFGTNHIADVQRLVDTFLRYYPADVDSLVVRYSTESTLNVNHNDTLGRVNSINSNNWIPMVTYGLGSYLRSDQKAALQTQFAKIIDKSQQYITLRTGTASFPYQGNNYKGDTFGEEISWLITFYTGYYVNFPNDNPRAAKILDYLKFLGFHHLSTGQSIRQVYGNDVTFTYLPDSWKDFISKYIWPTGEIDNHGFHPSVHYGQGLIGSAALTRSVLEKNGVSLPTLSSNLELAYQKNIIENLDINTLRLKHPNPAWDNTNTNLVNRQDTYYYANDGSIIDLLGGSNPSLVEDWGTAFTNYSIIEYYGDYERSLPFARNIYYSFYSGSGKLFCGHEDTGNGQKCSASTTNFYNYLFGDALYAMLFSPRSNFDPKTPPPSSTSEYTVSYQLSEDPNSLNTAPEQSYTSSPMRINYTFSNPSPGRKTLYVKFKTNKGNSNSTPYVLTVNIAAPQNTQGQTQAISGIYPFLALFGEPAAALKPANAGSNDNNYFNEHGIGAMAFWAGKLWIITYPAHRWLGIYGVDNQEIMPHTGLYTLDPNTLTLIKRSEGVGGTQEARMIHKESNQLIIGPYFINNQGNIRVVNPKDMPGRISGVARHLTDPANKIYFYTMEQGLYEVDVNTLVITRLHTDANKLLSTNTNIIPEPIAPGAHGKSVYSGQGHLYITNNGWDLVTNNPSDPKFEGGALAEWNGQGAWQVIDYNKYTDVTGPNGINGEDNPQNSTSPIWAIGWDHRSSLLNVRYNGEWKRYRIPRTSHVYDPKDGWATEWPRIHKLNNNTYIMNLYGMYYKFPGDFRPGNTNGITPLSSHLQIVNEIVPWNNGIIIGGNDATRPYEIPFYKATAPHSNLRFFQQEDLSRFGQPEADGGPWVNEKIAANQPSEPFFIGGFSKRVIHFNQDNNQTVNFTLEIDQNGTDNWSLYQNFSLTPYGSTYIVLPLTLTAQWMRFSVDQTVEKGTVYFRGNSDLIPVDNSLVTGLATPKQQGPRSQAILISRGEILQLSAKTYDASGNQTSSGAYEIGENMLLNPVNDSNTQQEINDLVTGNNTSVPLSTWPLYQVTANEPPHNYTPYQTYLVDEASVIMKETGKIYRLPKGDPIFNQKLGDIWPRGIGKLFSEAYIMNIHGTFYELPLYQPNRYSQALQKIRPITTHNMLISDFTTWRGMMVLSGVLQNPSQNSHMITSSDQKVSLWFGNIDDLWKFGSPKGQGGPWLNTTVSANQYSDPYLMGGYTNKRLTLSHTLNTPVVFTAEVDPTGDDTWMKYQQFVVNPGQEFNHVFPDGYSAQWIRFKTNLPTQVTAQLDYSPDPFTIIPTPVPTQCNRCSIYNAYQRTTFESQDSTCAQVVPSTTPINRTCDCSCPSSGLNTTWDSSCISSCTATPTPTPTSTETPEYTVSYQVAESQSDLNTAPEQSYTGEPMRINYQFKNPSPGRKTLYVKFKTNKGNSNSTPYVLTVNIAAPTPTRGQTPGSAPTATPTVIPTLTSRPTNTPTSSPTPTRIPTPTSTPIPTPTSSPTPTRISTPSPTRGQTQGSAPTATNTPIPTIVPEYTKFFKIAELPTELDNATAQTYSSEPLRTSYTFRNTTPGEHFLWIRFITDKGNTRDISVRVILAIPAPTATPTSTPVSSIRATISGPSQVNLGGNVSFTANVTDPSGTLNHIQVYTSPKNNQAWTLRKDCSFAASSTGSCTASWRADTLGEYYVVINTSSPSQLASNNPWCLFTSSTCQSDSSCQSCSEFKYLGINASSLIVSNPSSSSQVSAQISGPTEINSGNQTTYSVTTQGSQINQIDIYLSPVGSASWSLLKSCSQSSTCNTSFNFPQPGQYYLVNNINSNTGLYSNNPWCKFSNSTCQAGNSCLSCSEFKFSGTNALVVTVK